MPVPSPKLTYMAPEEARDAISALGWTQAEAAEMLGYTRWTVNGWVTGRLPVPFVVAQLLRLYVQDPSRIAQPRPIRKR